MSLCHGRLGGGGPAGRAPQQGHQRSHSPVRASYARTASRREPTSPQAPQTWDDDAASAARSRRSSAPTDASAPPSVPATRSVAASRRASLEWPTASNVSEASVPARTSTA